MVQALQLECLEDDLYETTQVVRGRGRAFGGQIAAQALRAATLTVEASLPVHSLHSYFIRPGRPGEPVRHEVTRTRDGRSFSTRSVVSLQEGKPIFQMLASFQAPEPGEVWQPHRRPPVRLPGDLDSLPLADLFAIQPPFEIKPLGSQGPPPYSLRHPFWVRTRATFTDDPALHACMLVYVSDLSVVNAARSPASAVEHQLRVSLDHSIWFHRPVRADQWFLYNMTPHGQASSRGLAYGTMHTLDGDLAATISQEVLLR